MSNTCIPKVLGRYEYDNHEIVIVNCIPIGGIDDICSNSDVENEFQTNLPRVVQVNGGAEISCNLSASIPSLSDEKAVKAKHDAIKKRIKDIEDKEKKEQEEKNKQIDAEKKD